MKPEIELLEEEYERAIEEYERILIDIMLSYNIRSYHMGVN